MPNTAPTRTDVAGLAGEVRDLAEVVRDRDRHFRIAIAVGSAALLIALVLAGNAWVQSQEAKDQSDEQDKLAAVQELDRCLGSNGARQASIDGFEVFASALIAATTPSDGDPERMERFEATVARFRQAIDEGLEGLEPSDCTGDGIVTEEDFPGR